MANRRLKGLHVQTGQSVEVLTIKDGKVITTHVLSDTLKDQVIKTHVIMSDHESQTNPKVSEYLTNYWQACAEGRLSEATQWAVQALALDPACFSKSRDAGGKKLPPPAVAPSAN
jgi:hypothetical protein